MDQNVNIWNIVYNWYERNKMNKKVIKVHQKELMGKENVVGVGRGLKDGKDCVVVFVEKKKPLNQLSKFDVVPKTIKGNKTEVIEVGVIKALNTGRFRPVVGGASIGHVAITAGTAGCVVKYTPTGKDVVLSNNHVLADSNLAELGDSILQPGAVDGGVNPTDVVGVLSRFKTITFDGDIPVNPPSDCPFAKIVSSTINKICEGIGSKTRYQITRPRKQTEPNLVDAAIMSPLNDIQLNRSIIDVGIPNSALASAFPGLAVKKSGRTTEFTTGSVLTVETTVKVNYGQGRDATFEDQIMLTPMSEGGDSGSLILVDDVGNSNNPVGLLFAGSPSVTIANDIVHVMDALDVAF